MLVLTILRRAAAIPFLLLLALPAPAQTAGSAALLVLDVNNRRVLEYAWPSGAYVRTLIAPVAGGPCTTPMGMRLGPNGGLYVTGRDSDNVVEFNAYTGAFVRIFAAGSNGNTGDMPTSLAFRTNGLVYLSTAVNGSCVHQYSAAGGYVASSPCHGAQWRSQNLAFGPLGTIFVSWNNWQFPLGRVVEHNATTGTLVRVYDGSLSAIATGVAISPSSGNLFVSDFLADRVVQYDTTTGQLVGYTFASAYLDGPQDLVFGPNGNLFVASGLNHRVIEFDGATGAFVREAVAPYSGGLDYPIALVFRPRRAAAPQ